MRICAISTILHFALGFSITRLQLCPCLKNCLTFGLLGASVSEIFFRVSTCAVLIVVFVEFKKNGGWNHQEIPERGCGRMSNDWKPLAQAAKSLKQRNTSSHKNAKYNFDFSSKFPISIT